MNVLGAAWWVALFFMKGTCLLSDIQQYVRPAALPVSQQG